MGPQVEAVVQAALGDLGQKTDGLLNGLRWVNECLEDLSQRRLKANRRVGELVVPKVERTGQGLFQRGSDVVVFDADAVAATTNVYEPAGRYLQAGVNQTWYRIAEYNPTTGQLKLEQPWIDTADGLLTYHIVARNLELDPAAHYLGAFCFPRREQPLDLYTAAEIDLVQPARRYRLGGPMCVIDQGEAQDGARIVELYPYSEQDEFVTYTYWRPPAALGLKDYLPQAIAKVDLKVGVLVGVMRWKMAMAVENGKIDEAAFWRNEYRTQEKMWDRAVQNLVKRDQGVEDITLLLRTRYTNVNGRPIMNAHDEVWSRG